MLATDTLEPLTLADGTKINPANGKVIKDREQQRQFVEIPSASEAQAIVARTRRSVAELPLAPNNMNVVSLVLFYTMWGLQDNDIAIVVGLAADQIKQIKKLEQFKTLSDDIRRSVLDHDASDIKAFFQAKSHGAAMKIAEIADEDDGVLGFKASQDILDRAGLRPADIVEHRHTMQDALRIEHIVRDDRGANDLPTIDTTYRDVTPNADRT